MTTTEKLMVEADALISANPDGLVGDDRDRVEAIAGEIRQLREQDEKHQRDVRVAELETRIASGDVEVTRGDNFDKHANLNTNSDPFEAPGRETSSEVRSRALSAIERWNADDDIKEAGSKVVEKTDEVRGVAEHVLLTSHPSYVSAFNKLLRDPEGFRDILEPDERQAWSDVRAMQTRAALDIAGSVLPSPLDPSIVLTNAGVVDPMRGVASVSQTVANTKRFITSAGVTASFDAELTEVSDDTPGLTEITITMRKAQAFVQASMEAAADQEDISSEVVRMIGDAKARLEGDNFITGLGGSNEPVGIEGKLDGGASEFDPDTAEVFASVDVYGIAADLSPRWRGNATWMAELSTLNEIDKFETSNGAKLFNELGNANPSLLRRPVVENSSVDAFTDVDAAQTADNFIIFYGDFSQYQIVDRVGMVVQFIPALLATANNLPDGRVGWYATWRVGADLLNIDALRVLDILTAA